MVILLLSVAAVGIGGCAFYAHSHNTEVQLRASIEAQQKVCLSSFDKTWKIIQQQAQVAERYKTTFKEIYPQLMEGRYGNARGGALMSFIQESNPQFDTRLFDRLAASIEAQRTAFHRDQQLLIDRKREHDVFLQSFPVSLIVGSRSKVEIQLITSARTEEAYQSGQENDLELFKEDRP